MTKNNTEIFNKKSNERLIIDDINKSTFFDWMKICGFDKERLCEIFDSKRISAHEQNLFNQALRKAKTDFNIDLFDAAIYLEEYAVRFRKLISLLDNQTNFLLKKEIAEKFKISNETNNLFLIFGDDDEI